MSLRRRHRSSEHLAAEDDAFLGPVALHRPKSAHGQPRCAYRSLSAEQFVTIVVVDDDGDCLGYCKLFDLSRFASWVVALTEQWKDVAQLRQWLKEGRKTREMRDTA